MVRIWHPRDDDSAVRLSLGFKRQALTETEPPDERPTSGTIVAPKAPWREMDPIEYRRR